MRKLIILLVLLMGGREVLGETETSYIDLRLEYSALHVMSPRRFRFENFYNSTKLKMLKHYEYLNEYFSDYLITNLGSDIISIVSTKSIYQDKAYYTLEKNKINGVCILERVFLELSDNFDKHLSDIQSLNENPDYLNENLRNLGFRVYEKINNGFIERYILKEDVLYLDSFYEFKYENEFKSNIENYLSSFN